MNTKIKIILVDDHKIIRDGIKAFLSTSDRFEVIAEAENGTEAVDKLNYYSPDLLIMDINMPEMNGLEATYKIREMFPSLRILILTMSSDYSYIRKLMDAGINGYLLKNFGRKELIHAIEAVIGNEFYFSPEISKILMNNYFNKNKPNAQVMLSGREKEVLKLIAKEYTNQEIASKLFISVRTVDAHRRNIMEKTKCRNVVGLVRFAYESGLI